MRILHSWLKLFIDFKLKPELLAERLGMLGLEVEGIERLGEKHNGFVVGQVLTASRHPNADKLTVCSVEVGDETLQVVCGAPNVAPGQKVAVGKIGATVPRNQHDPSGSPFVLSKVKIRGVESSGMICSEFELGLGKDAEGILVLDSAAKVGQPLAEYFGLDDIAYDIEVTPNRPDWLSHFGVAREIGVIVKKKPKLPIVKVKESREPIQNHLQVKVEDKGNCFRFAARMIRGVKIGPSPLWLQNTLRNVGLRPRNNVVDVTNYVMLESGQPLHAFDYALLKGKRIVVRQTREKGKFTTLDGREHLLPHDAVMVCDAEREVSIAGIMGGENSEINDATVDVVLESACWNPLSIRRTRRALGISTDASQRFERGTNPEGVWYALQRATQLVHELACGEVLKGTIDVVTRRIRPAEILLRTERVNAILGTSLTIQGITQSLHVLGIEPATKNRQGVKFRIPPHRVDLEREIDLIEEVARVFGYDNIEEKSTALIDFSRPLGSSTLVDDVREELIAFGYHEGLSYTLQNEKAVELEAVAPVHLLNPRTVENSTMRTSLVPGLMDAVARNISFGQTDVRLFEIGKVYSIDENSPEKLVENFVEQHRVCLVLTGNRGRRHWGAPSEPCDIFDMKGDVFDLLWKFALDKSGFICYSTSNRLADSRIVIEINGSYAGYLGKVSAEVLQRFGIEQEVYTAEILLTALGGGRRARQFTPLPKYPAVKRDVAFIVDDSIPSEDVERVIRSSSTFLLQGVELFDVYRGENIGRGKKSLAFTLDLMSRGKTLTDADIDMEMKRIVERVVQKTGAVLRGV